MLDVMRFVMVTGLAAGTFLVWGCHGNKQDAVEQKTAASETHAGHDHSALNHTAHTHDGHDHSEPAHDAAPSPQATCPVMGAAINKDLYVDHNGKRIYVCCDACIEEVRKSPEKYLKKLEEMGQKTEDI